LMDELSGRPDYWVENRIPHFANSLCLVPIGTPDRAMLAALEIKIAGPNGRTLTRGIDYTIGRDNRTWLYSLSVSAELRHIPLSIRAGFFDGIDQPQNGHELILQPVHVRAVAEQMRDAGIESIGKAIVEIADSAAQANRRLSLREIEVAFQTNALYSD